MPNPVEGISSVFECFYRNVRLFIFGWSLWRHGKLNVNVMEFYFSKLALILATTGGLAP